MLVRCERKREWKTASMRAPAQAWELVAKAFVSLPPESARSLKMFLKQQVGFVCPHHLWLSSLLKLHSYKGKSIICRSHHLSKCWDKKPKATTKGDSNEPPIKLYVREMFVYPKYLSIHVKLREGFRSRDSFYQEWGLW